MLTETLHMNHTLNHHMLCEPSFVVSRLMHTHGVEGLGSDELYNKREYIKKKEVAGTHSGKGDTTVTTFRSGSELFDVVVNEFASGGFDDSSSV